MTFDEFVAKRHLAMTVERLKARSDKDPSKWARDASHWKCIIRHTESTGYPPFIIEYSMGSAHKKPPILADVLQCVASDASSVDNARSFDDWAGDYGYDTDSRKAFAIWETCLEQARSLRHFLGSDAYAELMTCEEA